MLFVYFYMCNLCFFYKQKTAYERRIIDWSSDVCSSDLAASMFGHVADQCGRMGHTRAEMAHPAVHLRAHGIKHLVSPDTPRRRVTRRALLRAGGQAAAGLLAADRNSVV